MYTKIPNHSDHSVRTLLCARPSGYRRIITANVIILTSAGPTATNQSKVLDLLTTKILLSCLSQQGGSFKEKQKRMTISIRHNEDNVSW